MPDFSQLPDLVLDQVCEYVNDTILFAQTCKRFQEFATDPKRLRRIFLHAHVSLLPRESFYFPEGYPSTFREGKANLKAHLRSALVRGKNKWIISPSIDSSIARGVAQIFTQYLCNQQPGLAA